MKIYRPVKSAQINQKFGKANTPPSLLPIYASFGHLGHSGWDFGVVCKDFTVKTGGLCEPIFFDLDIRATITSIQRSVEHGFGVVARSEDESGTFEHLWWHLDSVAPNWKVGDVVESGQFLGIAGNTGRTTGPHLHRELRLLAKDVYGNYYKKDPNNGYGGAVSMEPFYVDEFIVDKMNNLQTQVELLKQLIELIKKLQGMQ